MIHVGTCGYSYADWKGRFYPAAIKPAQMLEYYAERFNAVELDVTYYRLLPPSTFASMDRRTPASFRFTAKLPQTATHGLDARSTIRVHDDVAHFRESIDPLAAAGKLACVLAQFPNSFKPDGYAEEYLHALRGALPDIPLVAEFRNAAWQTPQTFALLEAAHIGWCNVDEPAFRTLMHAGADAIGPVGYVRLHGRNASKWWRHTASHERYDYLYTEEELAPWVNRVGDIEAATQSTYVFFNNHYLGKAATNAKQFAAMLGLALPEPPSDLSLF